jgi:hypothetical protein
VSDTQPVLLDFKKHGFKVFCGDVFAAAFSNEACAAMTAVSLQQSTLEVVAVHKPDGTSTPSRRYLMNATGNRIEGIAA